MFIEPPSLAAQIGISDCVLSSWAFSNTSDLVDLYA
jgi:hypothetical protein